MGYDTVSKFIQRNNIVSENIILLRTILYPNMGNPRSCFILFKLRSNLGFVIYADKLLLFF